MTDTVATHTSVLSSTAPEPGQLVEVRRRQWIVSDVDASAVSPELPKRNLVKLASIDEDALGEEIEVLWELEPGAHVIERAGLPTLSALDDPSKLEAFLDAVRWGAATNADRGYLQAPFRSGASIEDYQLDPLVRAIDMARTNLLIADDVGLGKGPIDFPVSVRAGDSEPSSALALLDAWTRRDRLWRLGAHSLTMREHGQDDDVVRYTLTYRDGDRTAQANGYGPTLGAAILDALGAFGSLMVLTNPKVGLTQRAADRLVRVLLGESK